jgi:cytochrome c oxidase assembly protein Cox11
MISNATITRFVESFVAVFAVAFAASPIFNGTTDLFGADGLHAIVIAAAAALLLAARRVLAVQ